MNILSAHEKELKTQKIARVAQRIFQTQDFTAISMAQIASQSGIAKGTLFNYFETKENLFMYLLLTGYQKYLQEVIQQWQNFPPSLTWEQLEEFLIKQNRFLIQEKPELLRLDALRAPLLEIRANRKQTLTQRQKLYQINQKLGQIIAQKVDLINAQQAGHLFITQSAIISGLMNMMGLDEFNHAKLQVNFEEFKIDLEKEANQVWLFYLQGLHKQLLEVHHHEN